MFGRRLFLHLETGFGFNLFCLVDNCRFYVSLWQVLRVGCCYSVRYMFLFLINFCVSFFSPVFWAGFVVVIFQPILLCFPFSSFWIALSPIIFHYLVDFSLSVILPSILKWNLWTRSVAFVWRLCQFQYRRIKLLALFRSRSAVLSADGFQYQCTRFRTRRFSTVCSIIFSTSYSVLSAVSSSLSTFMTIILSSGSSTAIWYLSSFLPLWAGMFSTLLTSFLAQM